MSAAAAAGVLTLTGGSGNDSFVVIKSGTNISVVENGSAAKLFALSSVTRINASLAGGNDTINIGNSLTIPASVSGGDGDDGIITGGANDSIDAGTGNDYIEGRDGQDLVTYVSRSVPIEAELNLDLQWRNASPPIIQTRGSGGAVGENDSYYSVETVAGGSASDLLRLTAGHWDHDTAALSLPQVGISGNGGDDVLTVSGITGIAGNSLNIGRQFADGGAGNDAISVLEGSMHQLVTVLGGDGDDLIYGRLDSFLPVVQAGAGSDRLYLIGRLQVDYAMPAGLEQLQVDISLGDIIGNEEDNEITVTGIDARLTIDGRGGNDRITVKPIRGDCGNSTIIGGEGNDTIDSSADRQYIEAGEGDDVLELDGYDTHNDQTVVGSSGNDTLMLRNYGDRFAATVHLIQPETFADVFIGAAAELIVEPGTSPEGNVLRAKHFYMWTDSTDPPALLNLNDNPLIISESGLGNEIDDPRTSLTRWLRMGRDGTYWGRGGILSFAVDSTPGTTLGVAQASEIFTTFPATFAGHTLASTDVVVRYTRAGDVNLDRRVDFADLVVLSQNYGQPGRSYARGDLDLSGTVDFADLVILSQGYGASMQTVAASIFAPTVATSIDKAKSTSRRLVN